MCHLFFTQASFFVKLIEIDRETAATVKAQGCAHCGGILDVSNYKRKPRCLFGDFKSAFRLRFSFCCRRHGCRKRLTPPSVRFFGRKVFWSMILLLAAAQLLAQGLEHRVRRQLIRWRQWWLETVPTNPGWQKIRGHFLFTDPTNLPYGLIDRPCLDQIEICRLLVVLGEAMKPP